MHTVATLRLQRDRPRNGLENGHVELDVGGQEFTGQAKRIVDATRLAHVNAVQRQRFGMGPEGAFAATVGR